MGAALCCGCCSGIAPRARSRGLLLVVVFLFVLWHALDVLDVRTDALGHAHHFLHAASAAAIGGLYAPDAALDDQECPPLQGAPQLPPPAPRLWLWWTATRPGALPSNAGNYLEACFASARRHGAAAGLEVTLVNSSATRGPGAPFPLRRFPLPPYFDALPINHQGDFGSFAVLAEYGGIYLDTDVLVLHDLAPFWALLRRFQFVGFGGHIYDEGVHHGLMAALPGAEVLVRTYHAALGVYESEGGCGGATCTRLGGLRWLSTLDAFSREAKALLHSRPSLGPRPPPCAYARLPTRHFEPGMREHQDMCSPRVNAALAAAESGSGGGGGGRDAEAERFLVSTMAAAVSGVLRVVHLSTTKSESGNGKEFSQCPLVDFLWGVARGAPNATLVQAVAASAVGGWEQAVQDFMPL